MIAMPLAVSTVAQHYMLTASRGVLDRGPSTIETYGRIANTGGQPLLIGP